jgi:hypothetical protein
LGREDNEEEENAKGKAKGKGKAGGDDQSAFEAVRTETHKYVEYGNGEKELYDLQADPYELDSAHETADPFLVKGLKTKLDALKRCSGAGCREAEDAP